MASVDVKLLDQPASWLPIAPFPAGGGGECVFLGRTRAESHPKHGALVGLRYEAYRPMAEVMLRELAQQAIERFGCQFVRVHHAVGDVPLGMASVLVQTVCAHRAGAFDACRFVIDKLKSEAPIWKREEWNDGATWSAGTPVLTPAATPARERV